MKRAFTLAEVLITLGIIGVVAAMTMPALIGNYQKKVVVERLKKVYTTMKQVESLAITDYGDISEWAPDGTSPIWSPNPGTAIMKKFVLPYVDAIKICEPNECEYKFKQSNGTESDVSSNIGFYLKDGSLIKIYAYHGTSDTWGYYLVDINGDQKPNLLGRDVFIAEFDLNNGGRCGKESLFCFNPWDACKSDSKLGCYKTIYKAGWQIKKDYPW